MIALCRKDRVVGVTKCVNLKRNTIYDVLKGLGIIAVVLGHCHPDMDVVRFVYGFHLAVFFFVAGLQFNDAKYASTPFLLFQNRVKSMWPSYFGYMTLFSLTGDLFYRLNLLSVSTTNGLNSLLDKIINNFFFSGSEILGGGMWFVPMLLSGTIIFSVIVYVSAEYIKPYRLLFTVLLSCFTGVIGLIACNHGYQYRFYTHISFLLIPIFLLGYLVSFFEKNVGDLLHWPIAGIAFGVFVYFTVGKDCLINLASSRIVSVYLFYPITICGIYFVAWIAKMLSAAKGLSKVFSFLGKYSFDIMALHFLIIKTIDFLYCMMIGDDPAKGAVFPCAYPGLWPIYVLASITVAPCIRIGINKVWARIKCFFNRVSDGEKRKV